MPIIWLVRVCLSGLWDVPGEPLSIVYSHCHHLHHFRHLHYHCYRNYYCCYRRCCLYRRHNHIGITIVLAIPIADIGNTVVIVTCIPPNVLHMTRKQINVYKCTNYLSPSCIPTHFDVVIRSYRAPQNHGREQLYQYTFVER